MIAEFSPAGSQGQLGLPARLVCQYRAPIDYTPIDLYVIGNSAARLFGDVPDNTAELEHLSFTNLSLNLSRLTYRNLITAQSLLDGYMQIQEATCAD